MPRPKGSKNPNAGAKPLWKTPEELEAKIQEFWDYVKENKVPATIERAACILDCTPETIRDYGKKDKFSATVKKLKLRILADKVENLNTLDGTKTGIIFDLKNNHGWKDKTEVDHGNKDDKPFKTEEVGNKGLIEAIQRQADVFRKLGRSDTQGDIPENNS